MRSPSPSPAVHVAISRRLHGLRTDRLCLFAVALQGLSHITTQLVLFRELLVLCGGNELVIGVVLAIWLLMTGLGARYATLLGARAHPLSRLIAIQLGLAIVPLLTIALLRQFTLRLFLRGADLGLAEIVATVIIALSPYCMLAGAGVAVAAEVVVQQRQAAIAGGNVFAADGLGDCLGGLAFAILVMLHRDHFQVMSLIGLCVAFGAVPLVLQLPRRQLFGAWVSVTAIALAASLATPLDLWTLRPSYPGRELLRHESSFYADWVVTEAHGQRELLGGGHVFASSEATEHAEMVVHLAMAQRPNARRVLVVGGAAGPVLEQLLLYPVEQLDCIELDPTGTALSRQYLRGPADRRIRHIAADPRVFVRETRARYDVIITNLFDPTTLQLNRFYTAEYFAAVRGALAEGGVLSLAIGEYNDSLTDELTMILASTHHTLSSVFSRVLVLPTERVTLLASNSELTRDIAGNLERQRIRLRSLNRSWFEATLSADRFAELERATRAQAPINRDAWPVLTRHVVHGWLQRFDAGIVPWIALVLGLVAVASLLRGRVPLLIASLGFAASGLEVLLLIGIQMLAGAVYGALCAIVSAYLFGSTVGSLITRQSPAPHARRLLVSLALGSVGITIATYLFISAASAAAVPTSVCVMVVVALAALSGCVTGAAIPLGIQASHPDTPGGFARIFAADVAGAAIGAGAVGVVLIPRLGAAGTVGVLCGICLLGAVGPALSARSAP